MEVIQHFDIYMQDNMFRLGFYYGVLIICLLLIFLLLVSKLSSFLDRNKDKNIK